MAHIDCKMAHETTTNKAGQVEMSCELQELLLLQSIDGFLRLSRRLEAPILVRVS